MTIGTRDRRAFRRPVVAAAALVLALVAPLCRGSDGIGILDTAVEPARILQGDLFTIKLALESDDAMSTLTAAFSVVDERGDEIAEIESDFFGLAGSGKHELLFDFRWADFDPDRTGTLRIASTAVKHYDLERSSHRVVAERAGSGTLKVDPVTSLVHRLFASRENSLWWLIRMGRVDTRLARKQGLAGCVMFGGASENWTRNDFLARPGGDALCYWEITGYAVRVLALEYQRTGEPRYLKLAKQIAWAVVRNLAEGGKIGLAGRYLPTFNYFDGRIGDWYKGKAVLFDHGQILMGLLELIRVMEDTGVSTGALRPFREAARDVGEFMLAAREASGGSIPSFWSHANAAPSRELTQSTKTVIGFGYLGTILGMNEAKRAGVEHLNQMLDSDPESKRDHHGRAYMGYGFARGFQDYGDPRYLQAASEWTDSVANDMDEGGRLHPTDEYSAVPAQSQLIRNGTLLWKLTGEPRFLDWAARSAQYLARSPEPWTYRKPVLQLGRFYRQAGGQYNNIAGSELCSWASIFHIDAMYQYLGASFGHVFVGRDKVVSLRGPVEVDRRADRVSVRTRGSEKENIGVYIESAENGPPIADVQVDGESFPYFTARTARIPASGGEHEIEVLMDEGGGAGPHLLQTSSEVLQAAAVSGESLQIVVRGHAGTTASARVFWPHDEAVILLDGKRIPESDWRWLREDRLLMMQYRHDGGAQTLEVKAAPTSNEPD